MRPFATRKTPLLPLWQTK